MAGQVKNPHPLEEASKFLLKPRETEFDLGFTPGYQAFRLFQEAVSESPGRETVVLGFERENGLTRTFDFEIFGPGAGKKGAVWAATGYVARSRFKTVAQYSMRVHRAWSAQKSNSTRRNHNESSVGQRTY